MFSLPVAQKCLILILALGVLGACQNSVPTVVSLGGTPLRVDPKNPKNFSQLSAGSQKKQWAGGYKGTLRVSQPLGRLQATSAGGYKLQGSVTLQR